MCYMSRQSQVPSVRQSNPTSLDTRFALHRHVTASGFRQFYFKHLAAILIPETERPDFMLQHHSLYTYSPSKKVKLSP
jgi:hypothetical protein